MKRAIIAFFATAWELTLMFAGVGLAYWMSNNAKASDIVGALIAGVISLYISNYSRTPKDERPEDEDNDPSPPSGMTFA